MMDMFEVEMDSAPMTNRDTDTILDMRTITSHNSGHHNKCQIRGVLLRSLVATSTGRQRLLLSCGLYLFP